MELRCERDVLVDALAVAGRATASRNASLPVLEGVRAELSGDHLSLTGTDLDLTISNGVTVAGIEDGAVVLPGRLTVDIVRALDPGAVHLVAGPDEAKIAAGRSQFSVRLRQVEDFPRTQETPAEEVTLDAAALAAALRQVVRAASHDDSRPILTGVLMAAEGDGLRLVATDSYRLGLRDLRGASVLSEGQSVLVPSRALGELLRLLTGASTATLRLGERDATFVVGETRLTTRLIEGEFPNYRQLIAGTQANQLTIGREPLLDALRRVRLLAKEPSTPVRLVLRPDGVELSATTQDVGQAQEDLDAKYEGTELTIAFNPEYLADGIDALAGDEVSFEIIDSLKRVVLRSPESEDYLYLLMPVRVS